MDKSPTEWIVKETEHGLVKVRQLVRCKDCIHWQGFKGKNSETGECPWMGHDDFPFDPGSRIKERFLCLYFTTTTATATVRLTVL